MLSVKKCLTDIANYFRKIERNIAYVSAVDSFIGTTSYKIISFKSGYYGVVGSKLNMTSNKINIGSGVNKVLVTISWNIGTPVTGGSFVYFDIRKNETSIYRASDWVVSGTIRTSSVTREFDVTGGDYFDFYFKASTDGKMRLDLFSIVVEAIDVA